MNRLKIVSDAISNNNNSYTKIIVEKSDKVGTLWLNSPKDLNCLSTIMTAEIKKALVELDHDSEIKIIVLRSKSNKIFCAGADIKHMQQNDYATYPHSMHFLSMERAFRDTRKPTLAIV